MRGPYSTVFVVVILLSSLSFALPGAGTVNDHARENLDRGGAWEPTDGEGWMSPADPQSAPAGDTGALTGFESLHQAGIEGDGVTVGVIGHQFGDEQRSLGDSVVDSQRFGTGNTVLPGTNRLLAQDSHDTAVAEIVSRTAPESDLYLADIGREATPERYADAVAWLLARDVDVVVDAASYFPADAEGMDRLNAVASRASEQGVVFVTSAGNYANRHWAGTATEDGWMEFAPETPYNRLGDGKLSGQTSLRLYWEGSAEFDLYLYRADPGDDTLVAKSAANQTGAGPHSEAIDTTLPTGNYYVAVRGSEGVNGTTVRLFAANHGLAETSDSGGMVAPATAENVIAVGAVDRVSGEPQPYSSSGSKLDISAPDGAQTAAAGELHGSSAAAPLVAGTVALMLSQNESLTPAAAQRVLQGTATRVDGRLYLDTVGAVSAVSSDERRNPVWSPWRVNGSVIGTAGDSGYPIPTFAEPTLTRSVTENGTVERGDAPSGAQSSGSPLRVLHE